MRVFFEWDKWTIAEAYAALNKHLEGKTLAELGRVQHKTALDALLDLALSEDLKTSFSPPTPGEDDESWRLRGQSWRDARTVVGGSDAGAHLDMLDTFAFTTKVLGEGVRRRGLLDLPEAIRQMTQVPAEYLGLNERGILREGYKADIVVFDPATVDCGPIHTRYDLPAGAPRLYADAIGVAHVFVNGREIVRGQEFLGDFPGRVLRSGKDTHTVSIPGAPDSRT
jgi:N-acyl-D-aspartate/D-glutamate deacylase